MSIDFEKLQDAISNYIGELDEKELEIFDADLGNFYDEHRDVQHQILTLLKLESLELKKIKSKTMLTESVVMPHELTAENGAKKLLIGEFVEVVNLECTACDQDGEDCEVCSGDGSYIYRVDVGWDTIKQIYKKAVEHPGVRQC